MPRFNKNAIRLEPSKSYDKAIVGVSKDGYIKYSYWKLIAVTSELYSISDDEARDWVDFNTLGVNNEQSCFKVSYRR